MASQESKKTDEPNPWRQYGKATAIPFVLAAGPLIGYVFGGWIDRRFESAPWGVTVLMILGFVAALRETVRLIRDTQ